MNLLAIETTGAECSVALRRAGHEDVTVRETIGRGHAERLAPMVRAMLDEAGLAPAAIERIGVAIGPGSFAGTRVGVAFARGLALATGASAVGISGLAILARAAGDETPLAALHDARRGELILQVWHRGTATAPERLPVAAAASRLREVGGGSVRLAGSGAALLANAGFEIAGPATLDLHVLLDLAAEADPAAALPSPFYARPPDAKLPGGVNPA